MATRSILINFAGYPHEPFHLMPDNGLANLAACLLEAGHETEILDFSTLETVERLFPSPYHDAYRGVLGWIQADLKAGREPGAKDIDDFHRLEDLIDRFQAERVREIAREVSSLVSRRQVDFVGMKLWTGAGFHGSLLIARQLKKDHPGLPVFGGGPHVDWFRERTYDVTDVFDALAYGEGEETIVSLARCVQNGGALREVPNLIFRESGRTHVTPARGIDELDRLPLPVYDADIYPAMRGGKILAAMIDESRGCPNACSFCIHSAKSGSKWRARNPAKVAEQMQQIGAKYGIRIFRFAGSNSSPALLSGISREILARRLDVSFSAFVHVRGMTRECLELLKSAGCRALAFGVESGSQRILDGSMNKRVSTDQIRTAISLCRDSGIRAVASFIFPAPLETEETREETLSLLDEVRPDSSVVFFPVLIPGTAWDRDRARYRFDIKDEERLFRTMMTYRAYHLSPPVLWRDVPGYRLNGKPFGEICRETSRFVQALAGKRLRVQMLDQTYLLAEASGLDPDELQGSAHRFFSDGDRAGLLGLVQRINGHHPVSGEGMRS